MDGGGFHTLILLGMVVFIAGLFDAACMGGKL